MKYYKEYLCVGGLPDAVNTFLLTKDLNQVYDIQIGILENYKDDFAKHLDEEEEKYVDKNELTKIMEVYNSIPSQLAKENKKFQYSKIDKKAKGREYRFAITWLEEFGLAKLCYNLNNIELPLEGNKNEECFKLYITDTGLFMAMLGNDTYNEILNKDMGIYKGAIYENIIAESFIKNGKNLYYFSKPSGLEIDFITKIKNEIVAVEVKSTNGNTKSLNELLKNDKYNVSNAIKLINGNIGQNNNIYTIPLYMSFLIGGQELLLLLLLSKEYISKDDFLNEIKIKKYHFELGGLDDQLWLINDANDVCDVVINLMLKDGNGDIIEDEIDYHLYDGSDAPYKGFLYTIEYKKSNIIEKLLSQLVTDTRKLYVEYNASGKFEQVKRN